MEKLLSIGKILNFHGIKGEVKVGYTAGKEDQLKNIEELYAYKDSEEIPLTVESIRFHKNFAIVKFKEISSIAEAAELKGALLKAQKSKIEGYLEENEFYIDDLVGLDVYDDSGNYIGKVDYIVNLKEEDLLSIKSPEGEEHLVPFVKDLVPEINLEQKRVTIKKIPGLIEKVGG